MTATNSPQPQPILKTLAKATGFILSICLFLAVLGFIAAAFIAIRGLGILFKQDELYSTLVGAGAIGAILGHAGYIARANTNSARMLHGIALLIWLLMALFFSGLYASMTVAGITPATSPENINALLSKSILPLEMVETGRMLYALTFAIGLTSTITSLIVAHVMSDPLNDVRHGSIGTALASSGETVIIGLVVASSALHMFNYGVAFAGVDTFAALTACVMAELTFIVSEKKAVSEIRRRADGREYDGFDLVLWVLLGVFALVYMIGVNWLYGRLAARQPIDLTLETITRDFYGVSAPIFGGLLAVLSVLTALVDVKRNRPQAEQATLSRPITARLAGHVSRQREGWNELTTAVRGRSTLPAPISQTYANTAPDAKDDELKSAAAEVAGGQSKSEGEQ